MSTSAEETLRIPVRRGAALLLLVLLACASSPGTVDLGVDAPPLGAGAVLDDEVGVSIAGSSFATVLARGCELPCKGVFEIRTGSDDQERIMIHLLRRASKAPHPISRLADFQIVGIPPGPARDRIVTVTLRARKDRLSISAVETATSTSLTIRTVLFVGE